MLHHQGSLDNLRLDTSFKGNSYYYKPLNNSNLKYPN